MTAWVGSQWRHDGNVSMLVCLWVCVCVCVCACFLKGVCSGRTRQVCVLCLGLIRLSLALPVLLCSLLDLLVTWYSSCRLLQIKITELCIMSSSHPFWDIWGTQTTVLAYCENRPVLDAPSVRKEFCLMSVAHLVEGKMCYYRITSTM